MLRVIHKLICFGLHIPLRTIIRPGNVAVAFHEESGAHSIL
jgi:hypothetical protein